MAGLSAQDLSFLERSQPGAPLNVAGLITLERRSGGLALARTRELVAEGVDRLPALRSRVARGAGAAAWESDPDFDVAHHVGELAIAADDPGLVDEVARLHTAPLPPDRPLWRLDVVPQGRDGGPKLLFRASHAFADGISSMVVMRSLFDPPRTRRPATGPGRAATPAEQAPPDAFEVARDIVDSLDPQRRERLGPEHYERALALLDGWLSMLDRGPHGLPRLPADGPLRTRVSLTEVPASRMRDVRRLAGARFDAIGLTVVGAAVGRLLRARGTLPASGDDGGPRIRTLVPVATSFGGGDARLGNHASFLLLALPIGAMDPRRRLALVAEELDEAITSGQHRAAAMSMRALETAPADVTERISSFTNDRRFVDLVVSCVPGSRRPLTFDALAHRITHAILPITEQVRLAVGWSDIAGRSGVAVTSDDGALPEREFFVRALERSADELAGAFGV